MDLIIYVVKGDGKGGRWMDYMMYGIKGNGEGGGWMSRLIG